MPKFSSLDEYVQLLNENALSYYLAISSIFEDLQQDIKVRLFAGQVMFYREDTLGHTFHSSPVVICAFFKDHLNVFAMANKKYQDQLPQYKFTTKGTMQIYYNVPLDNEVLSKVFDESLQWKFVNE